MTRENKLALVVGFALILFVGILISDHFSIARHQPTADLSASRGAVATRDQQAAPRYIAMVEPPRIPLPAVDTAPAPIEAGRTANGQLVRDLNEPISPEQDVQQAELTITEPAEAEVLTMGTAPNGQRVAMPLESRIAERPSVSADYESTAAHEIAADVPPGFEPVDESVRHQPYRFHDVMPGESLYAIVKNETGDASRIDEIAKLNNLADPGRLSAGQRLRIPVEHDAPTARTVAAANSMPAGHRSSESPARGGTRPRLAGPGAVQTAVATYTVKDGDNLSTIAAKVLGSRNRWQELYKLNKSVIRDPNNLKVGTKLVLPERRG